MKWLTTALLRVFCLLAMLFLGLTFGEAAVVVPGTANIFGAGHAVPPSPGGGGGGELPPGYSFTAGMCDRRKSRRKPGD